MYGYIYITTPKSSNWCYIGKRVKSKFDTYYVGSGVVIKDYLKTHKKADLICKILERCDSKESLENAEVIWIEIFHNECGEKCKNIAIGGAGGCTPETAPNRGKIPIYKDDKYIWICDNEFSKYEADGWKKGQPEFINKKKGKANRGKIPIYKDDKYIYIIPEEFSKYEADGWKKGYTIERAINCATITGKIMIHKGDESIYIIPEEFSKYEADGWKKGQTESSNEKRSNSGRGKKRIHKGDEDKWVRVEEYDYYIELGWTDGASDRTKQKQREGHQGKSLKKFYWQTPSGEIKIMAKSHVIRYHSDWILIGPVE